MDVAEEARQQLHLKMRTCWSWMDVAGFQWGFHSLRQGHSATHSLPSSRASKSGLFWLSACLASRPWSCAA
jgi:hypothetical protein